jgi:signal transduction histidine kinase
LDRPFQRTEHVDNGAPVQVEARVATEQVRQLYRQGVFVLLANVFNAVIVTGALWHAVGHGLLLGWTAAMSIMAVIRWRLRHAYMAVPRVPSETGTWARRAVAGSCAAGVLWGMAGGLFPTEGSLVAQLVVVFVLGGMGASAAGTISCYLPAFYGYFLPSILPLVVKLAWLGDRAHLSLSAMAALFVVLMSGVARNISRALVASFRLRFENQDLVNDLARAKRDLLEVNADLERRVAERTVQIARQADDRARLERDLQGARRLEAIGRLAGGVAHEFNNALSVVIAGIESLRDPRDVARPSSKT